MTHSFKYTKITGYFHFFTVWHSCSICILIWLQLKVQSCKLCNNKYMIASTQITNSPCFEVIKPCFAYKQKIQQKLLTVKLLKRKQQISRVHYCKSLNSFQDAFETSKRSFISAFSICITVFLTYSQISNKQHVLECGTYLECTYSECQ